MGTFTAGSFNQQTYATQNLFEIYELEDMNHTLTLDVASVESGGSLQISSFFTFGNGSITYDSDLIHLTVFSY